MSGTEKEVENEEGPSPKIAKLDEDQEPVYPAKIVEFKKPTSGDKVVHGSMEILDGKFKGLRGFFQNTSGYVWGYSLAQANLLHLKPNDVFQVEASRKTVTSIYENTTDTQAVPLVIKRYWLGYKSNVPQTTASNCEFSSWLAERECSEVEFKKWINDRLPPRQFFPLPSETYKGTVLKLIRESPKCDGGIVKITSPGPLEETVVLFEKSDFYLCGVSVDNADLRMILRIGDTISMQVQSMSSREQNLKSKKYPGVDEYEVTHSALLAFLGSKRPRGPDQQPKESSELTSFLDSRGLTLDEFKKMRASEENGEAVGDGGPGAFNYGNMSLPPNGCFLPSLLQLPPFTGAAIQAFCPNMPVPAAIPPMGPAELEQLSKCAVIISRALVVNMIKEQKGANINVGEIIETDEDVENAIRMGRWLTEALVAKMQTKLQEKVKSKLGPNFGSILSTQKNQIEAAVKGMTSAAPSSDERQMPPPAAAMGQTFQAPGDTAGQSLLEQQRLAQKMMEADKNNKGDLLHEARASREEMRRTGGRERRPRTPDLDPIEAEAERGMSPIELVRKYVMTNRRIRTGRDDAIVFGDLRYPKDMKTNFRISNNYELTGSPKEYYNMECIYTFYRNMNVEHSLYVRRAVTDNLQVVRKPDRDPLINYLTGKVDFVPNVENVSISELNPGMVMLEYKPSQRSRDNADRGQHRTDVDLKTGLPVDPIAQAISIVSAKISSIDPDAAKKWDDPAKDQAANGSGQGGQDDNPSMSALEQWKAKNNFTDPQNVQSSRKRTRSGDMVGGSRGNKDPRLMGMLENRNPLDNRIDPFENLRPEPRFPGNQPFPANNDNNARGAFNNPFMSNVGQNNMLNNPMQNTGQHNMMNNPMQNAGQHNMMNNPMQNDGQNNIMNNNPMQNGQGMMNNPASNMGLGPMFNTSNSMSW